MTSTVDTMKKFMNVLDTSSRGGLSGLNEAVQAVSRFSSANDWIQNFINECNDFNTTNSHGYTSVDNFLLSFTLTPSTPATFNFGFVVLIISLKIIVICSKPCNESTSSCIGIITESAAFSAFFV